MSLHHRRVSKAKQSKAGISSHLTFFEMTHQLSASNFDDYIADLHEHLDRLRELADVDEQSSSIVGDLAQAYSEHPSTMQTGDWIRGEERRVF